MDVVAPNAPKPDGVDVVPKPPNPAVLVVAVLVLPKEKAAANKQYFINKISH